MGEVHDFIQDSMPVLFWGSWLVLFYLAWPRLVTIGRNIFRRRSRGTRVRLIIPPLRPKWDQVLDQGLQRATTLFFGLSLLELLFRLPQLERYSIPIFAVCLGLLLCIRGARHYFRPGVEISQIEFPHIMDNTALGMSLLKVQESLERLHAIAAQLDGKGGAFAEAAVQLLEFVEGVRVFLVEVSLESADSTVLRQAQPLFIYLETLVAAFELLVRLTDEAELGKVSADAIEILARTKKGFEALQVARSQKLLEQFDILISVLRQLYKPTPVHLEK